MAGVTLTHILEMAKRGLSAQRFGIDITGHNIANAATPGYSRQRVDFRTGEVLKTNQGLLGTGVISYNGGRLRSAFVDEQVRNSYSSLQDSTVQRETLTRVESKVNELAVNGLGEQLTKFFNAFQSLAQQPEELGPRTVVINQGKRLVDSFHTSYQTYLSLQKEAVDKVQTVLERINDLGKKIADLDMEVLRLQSVNANPSDAKDQRDMLIDELSKLANVKVSEDSKGSVIVSIGGTVVASRAGSIELQIEYSSVESVFENADVTIPKLVIATQPYNDDSADDVNLRLVNVFSGELNGLMKVYNDTLTPSIMRLNAMANALIVRVNELHEEGAGRYNPELEDSPSGNSFFISIDDLPAPDDFVLGASAQLIRLSDEILADPNAVAASADSTIAGDNTIALQISDLANASTLLLNEDDEPTVTFNEYHQKNIDAIASAIFSASTNEQASQLVLQQMQRQQQEVSGVSTDEEMTNLINFQRAYDASAKVASTVNDMYLTLLNMV
jgi:flagellar hook-associated protein 1 FlgK